MGRDTEKSETPPTLFFEHSLEKSHVDIFLNFIGERLQPFSVALDRVFLEEELRRASNMWEFVFDGISDPLAVVDLNFQVLRSNKAFSRQNGNLACFESLFKNRHHACANCPLEKVKASSESHSGLVRGDGRVYEVNSYPVPFHSTLSAVINHYRDVSRYHALQSQLIRQEKMAALGELAGQIAHELNNPLTGIRSMAQVLLGEVEDPSQLQSDLTEVEKASERCQSIIKNLLEFATGDLASKRQVISLNELLKRTLPLLKTAMRGFNTDIQFYEGPLNVEVEPQLFQQVIFNLVVNACQAMGSSGDIIISTRRTAANSLTTAQLSVKDSGKGIAPEMLELIFEPFYTTKPAGEGTGLGLSISRDIIRKFGGDLLVHSELGHGSEFLVNLPDKGGSA